MPEIELKGYQGVPTVIICFVVQLHKITFYTILSPSAFFKKPFQHLKQVATLPWAGDSGMNKINELHPYTRHSHIGLAAKKQNTSERNLG